MKIKRLIALLLIVMMIVSLAACGIFNTTGKVYWLNFKPELAETLQTLAARYKEEKGVDVRIETPESGTYHATLDEEMSSDEPPTMFVINGQLSASEWAGSTLDLNGTGIAGELTTNSYNLTNEGGKLVGIPYCLECFGIAVNPDLIRSLGYSVEDIKDFESLKNIAEAIHSNASWLGFDAFSSPDMDASSSWRMTAHLANLEYFYEEREAVSSWSECPASLTGAYMSNYKNLYDLIINNSPTAPSELAAGGHDPLGQFTSGKTAFCLAGSWDYAQLSKSVSNVQMIPYYCGVKGEEKAALNSGSENFWAVNANVPEENQKATLAFMKWLVTDESASAALVQQLGNMPFQSCPASGNGFLSTQEQYLKDGRYKMEWLMTYQPNSDAYRADLVEAMNAYNASQTDANWDKVRSAFVNGWIKQYVAVHND